MEFSGWLTYVAPHSLTLFQLYTLPISHSSNLTFFQSHILPISHSSNFTLFQSHTLPISHSSNLTHFQSHTLSGLHYSNITLNYGFGKKKIVNYFPHTLLHLLDIQYILKFCFYQLLHLYFLYWPQTPARLHS